MLETSAAISRQYIDAVSVFEALEEAVEDAAHARVLKKVDSTFRIRKSQKYTAVNKDGFEVDIIRREREEDDPHPIKLSDEDEDFWVAQARRANVRLDSPSFSAVIHKFDTSCT